MNNDVTGDRHVVPWEATAHIEQAMQKEDLEPPTGPRIAAQRTDMGGSEDA